jgi:SSS family solute:Na+ symporter
MGSTAAVAFSGWDWLTLGLFFLGLIGIVLWVLRQKEETSADYFLAGRDAGWIAVGASIFASNIGSEHLVGLAGAGAESGMAMAHWEMHAWLILILGWVFVPFYARSRVFTMPEFLERRFCPSARSFLSVISLVSYVLTKVAVTVYAGGVVFKTVLGIDEWMGIDFFWIGALSLVLVTGLYTIFGGMKSVLYTSVLQAPVLILGSLVILVVGLVKLGGWGELERICADQMRLIRPPSDPVFPWTGVLFGSAIVGFWYWCTDQYIVQRTLSARSQKEARRGTLFAGYMKLLPVFIFMVPGMIAFALNQKGLIYLESSDQAFPLLVSTLLPGGMKGVVVGGLVAALMSSLASLFNSSATLFTVDFYKRYKPESSERHLVFVGRVATATVVCLGIVWIPLMKSIAGVLYEYLQNVQSLVAPGISAVFIMGVFFRGVTTAAGLAGLVLGFVLGMFRLILMLFQKQLYPGSVFFQIVSVNWLHYCIFVFLVCLVVIAVISLLTRKPSEKQVQGLTYRGATPQQIAETRSSWNRWDVAHSLVISGVIIGFYVYFW